MFGRIAAVALGTCAVFAPARSVCASEAVESARPMALGFNLDLLPTALSAANGKFGYAPQVWLGIGHARLRFVGSHLEPPDAFAFAPRGFRHPAITAFASIIDYTFGPRWDGWWLGSGFEIWQNSIQHRDAAGTARWSSTVFTVGGGYIWRFAQDWFIDPWLGGHVVLNPETVSLGSFEYEPSVIQGEVSLKIGWFLPI